MYILIAFRVVIFFVVIVSERRNLNNALKWGIIVIIFPIVGFCAYILFGNKLKFYSKNMLNKKKKTTKNYLKYCTWHKNYKRKKIDNLNKNQRELNSILKKYNCDIWHNNKIKYYLFGEKFINDLLIDIKNAKKFILIEYYIFANDEVGNILAKELIKKATEGVKIKIIYDAFGSRKTSNKFWEKLKQEGIEVCPFFPPLFKLGLLNIKVNYRNHRKIVCIDGKISHIGGLNIRSDHMGKNKKLSPWRDTNIRIYGSGTYALTDIFLNDWNFCNKSQKQYKIEQFFPKISKKSGKSVQIIENGPEKDYSEIKNFYVEIIKRCNQYLYIQTPYFVVDNDILEEIINAKQRGVLVKIFIPNTPDRKSVYVCTIICLKKLLQNNVDIYLYKEFIHSKVLITEDVLSIGSCNFDNRSFNLNFELTAIIFDADEIIAHKKIIENDINFCELLTKRKYNKIKPKSWAGNLLYKLMRKIV